MKGWNERVDSRSPLLLKGGNATPLPLCGQRKRKGGEKNESDKRKKGGLDDKKKSSNCCGKCADCALLDRGSAKG